MAQVFLGLGSNLGDRLDNLRNAVREILKIAPATKVSSVYETQPVGNRKQPYFLNMVLEIDTDISPSLLLRKIKAIETEIGRNHHQHLQPREIDIDILLYGGLSYRDAAVTVPHPELHRRRFVLESLNEIAPDVVHPTFAATIATLLNLCADTSAVRRFDEIDNSRNFFAVH